MPRIILSILFLPILNGCVGLATAPAKEKLAQFNSAYIVHLETPPLGVDLSFKHIIPAGQGGVLGLATGTFTTISVLAQLPEALKQAEAMSKALEQELSAKEVWKPAVQLANIAAKKIETTGIPVTIAEKPLKLASFTNKEINSWYNTNGPVTNYRDLSVDNSPYVIEIMESNGVSSKNLTLEVRVKLIDPYTGTILGRTREWEIVDLPDPDQVFKDNGRIYKEIFLSSGQKLIQKSLGYLGLISDE